MTIAIIELVDMDYIVVAEGSAALASAAIQAENAADHAEAAADTAVIAAAAVGAYPTVLDGENATDPGQSFFVYSGGEVTLYINNAGTGDEVASLATATDVALRPTYAELADGDGSELIGVQQSFTGAVLRSLADWFSDEISVMDFIPLIERVKVRLRTSTADLSYAFQAATDAAVSRGGATVKIPAGTYEVQGVTVADGVAYRGAGVGATLLKLPATPSAAMFSATAGSALDGGGFFDLHMDGGQNRLTAVYDCLDFSPVDSMLTYSVTRCYIENFRRGFNGSLGAGIGNDRFAVINECAFWGNDVGVFTNEHCYLHNSELRTNTVGIDGRINDFHCHNTRINFNVIGIGRDGTLTNSNFTACTLYKNVEYGARLGRDTTWSGGLIACTNDPTRNGGYGDVGIYVTSTYVNLTGGIQFGSTSPAACAAGAFVVIEVLGAPTAINITDNVFHLLGEGVGIESTDESGINGCSISNNVVTSAGRTFMRAFRMGSSKVSDNVVELTAALPSGEGVFEYDVAAPHEFSNNLIFSTSPMATGHALAGSMPSSLITNNLCRNFTAGAFAISNSGSTRFRGNVGYTTENSGEATIPSGSTSIAVAHGLSKPPSRNDFYVTPTNDMGAATKYWVSGAGATELTISVDVDPGATGASFGWQARIY